jgi:hypothetical protein
MGVIRCGDRTPIYEMEICKESHFLRRHPPRGIHTLRSDMVTRATMWKRVPSVTGVIFGVYWSGGVPEVIAISNAGRARLR